MSNYNLWRMCRGASKISRLPIIITKYIRKAELRLLKKGNKSHKWLIITKNDICCIMFIIHLLLFIKYHKSLIWLNFTLLLNRKAAPNKAMAPPTTRNDLKFFSFFICSCLYIWYFSWKSRNLLKTSNLNLDLGWNS